MVIRVSFSREFPQIVHEFIHELFSTTNFTNLHELICPELENFRIILHSSLFESSLFTFHSDLELWKNKSPFVLCFARLFIYLLPNYIIMGIYINIGNEGFQRARNSEYIDKSGLIAIVNSTLFTERRFSCVSRSRRFGKSLAAKMLNAYYDQSCDSRALFANLEIANDPSFEKHLNKYPVIFLDLTNFTTTASCSMCKKS